MNGKEFFESDMFNNVFEDMFGTFLKQRARQVRDYREQQLVSSIVSFPVGASVDLDNGVQGTIVRPMRTRFLVKATSGRLWAVAPGRMRLTPPPTVTNTKKHKKGTRS